MTKYYESTFKGFKPVEKEWKYEGSFLEVLVKISTSMAIGLVINHFLAYGI